MATEGETQPSRVSETQQDATNDQGSTSLAKVRSTRTLPSRKDKLPPPPPKRDITPEAGDKPTTSGGNGSALAKFTPPEEEENEVEPASITTTFHKNGRSVPAPRSIKLSSARHARAPAPEATESLATKENDATPSSPVVPAPSDRITLKVSMKRAGGKAGKVDNNGSDQYNSAKKAANVSKTARSSTVAPAQDAAPASDEPEYVEDDAVDGALPKSGAGKALNEAGRSKASRGKSRRTGSSVTVPPEQVKTTKKRLSARTTRTNNGKGTAGEEPSGREVGQSGYTEHVAAISDPSSTQPVAQTDHSSPSQIEIRGTAQARGTKQKGIILQEPETEWDERDERDERIERAASPNTIISGQKGDSLARHLPAASQQLPRKSRTPKQPVKTCKPSAAERPFANGLHRIR